VLVQPNGKIVVAGAGNGTFFMTRLNANGSPDTSFSADGKVSIDFAGHEAEAHGMVRQPDGKLVLAGNTYDGTQYDFALARMLP
jgi:uncharacterized delta-60 repeat protein